MICKRLLGLIVSLFIVSGCTHQTHIRKDAIKPFCIDDFSRLNKTHIKALVTPSGYEELQSIVHYARNNNLKISVVGSRHSQGGHAFYPNCLVISLEKLNKVVNFDTHAKLLTVQTGATWKDVQEYLHPHQCAVKIMQFANLFTVGGSLSVNCNGIDPHCGPLIESVKSIKILLADGSIVTASQTINSELFSLAIGGYGLFGIILEATIEVVDDTLYKRETKFLTLSEYIHEVPTFAKNPEVGFHFAFLTLSMSRKKLFGEVVALNFKKIDSTKLSKAKNKRKRTLFHEAHVDINRIRTQMWSKNRLIKALHWIPEGIKHGQIVSRNNIMRPPASHLYVELPTSTNLLQEYFIPVDKLAQFISELEHITKELKQNLMHVALRFIPQNTESYLSYTKTDCIGIVLFFNQKLTSDSNQKTQTWTQHLINTAAQLSGAYYLPIQLHASKSELTSIYPEINTFFALKQKNDPQELFVNHFYKKYKN